MFETPSQVFEWLEKRTEDSAYYLVLLNLDWGTKGEAFAIEVFSELAWLLKASPTVTKAMFAAAWRPQLVANVVVILQQASEFTDDLMQPLIQGSWVAPQLAVGVALLASQQAVPTLEAYWDLLLNSSTHDKWDGKQVMAIFSALRLVGSPQAQVFEGSPLFKQLTPTRAELNRDNWRNADNLTWLALTQQQWDFWRKVAPV
jgi:hypothetical protein